MRDLNANINYCVSEPCLCDMSYNANDYVLPLQHFEGTM